MTHEPTAARPAPPARLPYPRRIDLIARRAHLVFVAVTGIGLVALVTWANVTALDKVTHGAGKVIPQQQNQVVQHLEGGIITDILVKEGDPVSKGQPILRIENSFWRSELQQARIEIRAKQVRLARLEAETRLGDSFEAPEDLRTELPRIVERERTLFDSRRAVLREQLLTLDDQQKQKELELGELRLRYQSDAEKERTDNEVQMAKLQEGANALQDRSVRSEVVAPIGGIVNKLFVSTLGGVVKGGEPLAQIVPSDAQIAVEARLSPADRANVWPGLPAVVRVSAYDYSVYGGLPGKVVEVSPDALQDEKGQPYFRVRLDAHAADLGPDRPVIPGMLADINILTGKQTVMQALLRPIRHVRDSALRQ